MVVKPEGTPSCTVWPTCAEDTHGKPQGSSLHRVVALSGILFCFFTHAFSFNMAMTSPGRQNTNKTNPLAKRKENVAREKVCNFFVLTHFNNLYAGISKFTSFQDKLNKIYFMQIMKIMRKNK